MVNYPVRILYRQCLCIYFQKYANEESCDEPAYCVLCSCPNHTSFVLSNRPVTDDSWFCHPASESNSTQTGNLCIKLKLVNGHLIQFPAHISYWSTIGKTLPRESPNNKQQEQHLLQKKKKKKLQRMLTRNIPKRNNDNNRGWSDKKRSLSK